jgi:hypothetical protein
MDHHELGFTKADAEPNYEGDLTSICWDCLEVEEVDEPDLPFVVGSPGDEFEWVPTRTSEGKEEEEKSDGRCGARKPGEVCEGAGRRRQRRRWRVQGQRRAAG